MSTDPEREPIPAEAPETNRIFTVRNAIITGVISAALTGGGIWFYGEVQETIDRNSAYFDEFFGDSLDNQDVQQRP